MLIDSEDVKQAVIQRLLEIFPDIAVYKEAKTKISYPHFFVYQVRFTDVEERKDCHILTYSLNVVYRVASDPSTDLKLQQDLDNVLFKLTQKFNIIEFEESKVRCTNKMFDKVDSTLHFFFDIVIMAYDISDIKDEDKLLKLDLDIKLRTKDT